MPNSEPGPDRDTSVAAGAKEQDLRHGYTKVGSLPPVPRTLGLVAPEAAETPAQAPAEWAIIVNHGMGQQVHFETLEQIALAIRNAEIRARNNADPIRSRVVKLDGLEGKPLTLVRAEMTVKDRNEKSHSVHLYESYWAPLTEGKVTLRDVTSFLLEGGGNGFKYLAEYRGGFNRWVFGGMRNFPIHPVLTALKLVLALLIVFAPILLANLLTVAQAGRILLALRSSQPVIAQIQEQAKSATWRFLTPDVAAFEVCLAIFAFGAVILPKIYRSKLLAAESSLVAGLRGLVKRFAIVASFAALLYLAYVEGRFVVHGWRYLRRYPPAEPETTLGYLMLIWGVAVAAAIVSRWFLVEFLGDVAAYVSAHKLSKFDELREAIKKSVFEVMSAVYRAQAPASQQTKTGLPPVPPTPGKHCYQQIIVIGHSLGSVISYDVLNHLLLENEITPGCAATATQQPLDTQTRTKLLLTFGSPLDKIAFLFRIKGSTDELREAASAAWQPLIRDYGFRPDQWLNIYSWMDLFSAPLRYYDNPDDPGDGGPKRVKNRADWQALIPLVAHTEYWTDNMVGDVLYSMITTGSHGIP